MTDKFIEIHSKENSLVNNSNSCYNFYRITKDCWSMKTKREKKDTSDTKALKRTIMRLAPCVLFF